MRTATQSQLKFGETDIVAIILDPKSRGRLKLPENLLP